MVVAVVLAAGAGSRFAGPVHKLLAPLRGLPVVRHAVDHAVASALPVIVVTGAVELDHALPASVTVVQEERWNEGQVVSLRAGLAAADDLEPGCDAVVVGLGDQPAITPDAWRAVAASDAPIAVATYDGRRGNPVRLAREVWPLLPETGDAAGRAVMQLRPDLVREIPCAGHPGDIDTPEDLDQWS